MTVMARYRVAVTKGELRPDAAQSDAVRKLDLLARALGPSGFSLFRKAVPKGLYIWGDVGRGKTLLMDMFFEEARAPLKRRIHFNAFMVEIHARIHAERQKADSSDPIAPVARAIAAEARLLCFDEFQVSDVADAMILGRLFDQIFAHNVVIVATSNTPPDRLYEGGLNRQLFLPFITEIKQRMDVLELNGPTDYRLQRLAGLPVYLMPLGPVADAAMDAAWRRLTDTYPMGAPAPAGAPTGKPMAISVLGRKVTVPQAARGVARFSFDDLCAQPLGAGDYLAIAHDFRTVLIDHIPLLTPDNRNEARRFVALVDTLYDEGVKLVCSAAAAPEALYPAGDGADAFRRTASRLAEMQSEDYLRRGHGLISRTPVGEE